MDETPTSAKKGFARTAALTPELESDFKKRSAAFRDFARLNPDATLEELAAYRERVKPKDPMDAKLFAKWCVLELKKELIKS